MSPGKFTTTEWPHPPTHPTLITSVHNHPRFAHSTSLIADGFGDQRSTLRNVSNRSRKRSRSQGTKFGRRDAADDRDRLEMLDLDGLTVVLSGSKLWLNRIFFMVGDVTD